MSKPFIHAKSMQAKFGGDISDYLPLNQLMDESKSAIADNRHRMVFHSSFGCFVIEKIFGVNFERLCQLQQKFGWTKEEVRAILDWKQECTENGTNLINAAGKEVSVRDCAELHCVQDFGGFIPSLQDYADLMDIPEWLNNGHGRPPSHAKIVKGQSPKYLVVD